MKIKWKVAFLITIAAPVVGLFWKQSAPIIENFGSEDQSPQISPGFDSNISSKVQQPLLVTRAARSVYKGSLSLIAPN